MSSYRPVQEWQNVESAETELLDDGAPTLVIGDIARWNAQGRSAPIMEGFHFTGIEAVNTNLLDNLNPSMVISPLITDQFDAIDVARSLVGIGYTGRYRAVTEQLPNSRLVLQEIQSAAPSLDIDLFILPPKAAND